MSMRESRGSRRESRRAALRSVAAAPSFQPVKKKRARRSPVRRALIISTTLSVMVALLIAAPKAARAGFDTPEIDPGSMAGAMTLLVGGVLALTDRIRRA